jgi:hypothetical protein
MRFDPSNKFLGIIFCYFLTLSGPASCSLESLIIEDKWPQGKQRPHVVFDIDDTLCKKIIKGKDIRLDIHKRSPETILIPVLLEQNKIFTHAFFPGIAELFLSILSWGWNIDCFSSGVAERNESVIPNFLRVALAAYVKDPKKLVEYIMEDRLRIYSKQHMTKNSQFQRSGYDLLLISAKDEINPAEIEIMNTTPAIIELLNEDGTKAYKIRVPTLVKLEEEGDATQASESSSDETITTTSKLKDTLKGHVVRTIPEPKEVLKSFTAAAELSTYLAALFNKRSKIERRVFLEQTHVIAREIEANGGLVSKHPKYDRGGNYKKDLRALGVPLEHIILIDDEVTYAVGGEQYPPICVNWTASEKFFEFLSSKNAAQQTTRKGFDARENAGFLLGVLSRSRENGYIAEVCFTNSEKETGKVCKGR